MTTASSGRSERVREQLVVTLSTPGVARSARRIARRLELGATAELIRIAITDYVRARKADLDDMPDDYATLINGLALKEDARSRATSSPTEAV